jgi:hypothetical protein
MTIVRAVFKTTLFFSEIIHTVTASNTIINRLKIIDPDNSHIPLRNRDIKDRIAVFFRFDPSIVDFIASTKNIIIRAI